MERNTVANTVFGVFAVLALVGFYLLFAQIADLRTEVSNLQLAAQLKDHQTAAQTAEPQAPAAPQAQPQIIKATSSPDQAPNVPAAADVTVPSAVVTEQQSADTLLPQATTTVMLDSATEAADGTLTLNVRVYTNTAHSYTAIDLKKTFTIFNGEADNTVPDAVNGSFGSMPPASSITGQVVFRLAPGTDKVIIQVGDGDNATFYQFDFTTKAYKQIEVG